MAWPLAADVLAALRSGRQIVSTATHRNLVTGVQTPLRIVDGTVTVDGTAQCRRTLSLTVPAVQSTFDALDTPGGEITVKQSILFATKTVVVPLGVFIVDSGTFNYAPGEATFEITAPDRWLKVQRNRFGLARSSIPTNAAWQEIKRLVEGAWPGSTYPFPGWASVDQSATTKVGTLLWDDGDREAAIRAIETANALDVFFDATGHPVLRVAPKLTSTSQPVWVVNANAPDAVMTAAERSSDMSTVRNAVAATTSASDIIFEPVVVANTKAGDPLNTTGTLGFVPYYYDSPLLRSSAQAKAAAATMLNRQLGEAKQLTVAGVSNPALDADDVIKVQLPMIDRTTPRPSELHIIDSVTHPLVPGVDQQITTRSTRPDDGSDGSG